MCPAPFFYLPKVAKILLGFLDMEVKFHEIGASVLFGVRR